MCVVWLITQRHQYRCKEAGRNCEECEIGRAANDALRGTRDLAAHALTAPMAPVIALMALAAPGLSGNPVHKPVHEKEAVARPSERLNAPGPRGSGAFKRLRTRGQAGYSSVLGWPCG